MFQKYDWKLNGYKNQIFDSLFLLGFMLGVRMKKLHVIFCHYNYVNFYHKLIRKFMVEPVLRGGLRGLCVVKGRKAGKQGKAGNRIFTSKKTLFIDQVLESIVPAD